MKSRFNMFKLLTFFWFVRITVLHFNQVVLLFFDAVIKANPIAMKKTPIEIKMYTIAFILNHLDIRQKYLKYVYWFPLFVC